VSAAPGDRPLPVSDSDSEPFWAALREERLQVQRCLQCHRHLFYPRALCPHCHSSDLEWVPVAGTGTIYSYTVARRPAGPAFAADVPYVLVLVDLDEGVRMLSRLVPPDVDAVRIGARVTVGFDAVSDDVTLPVFSLVGDASTSR